MTPKGHQALALNRLLTSKQLKIGKTQALLSMEVPLLPSHHLQSHHEPHFHFSDGGGGGYAKKEEILNSLLSEFSLF